MIKLFLKEYVKDMNTSNNYRLTEQQIKNIVEKLYNDNEIADMLDNKFYDYMQEEKSTFISDKLDEIEKDIKDLYKYTKKEQNISNALDIVDDIKSFLNNIGEV
jgi:hypothetical protein